MRTVLVIQHVPAEGPAALGGALTRAGFELRTVRTFAGEQVPATLGDAAGLVVLGGPMGVYEADRLPHLRDEIALLKRTVADDRPVLGICLGSQLLAAALGARVWSSGRREVGWHPLTLTPQAADDALLAGLPSPLQAFHWHGDIFELPRSAVALAGSALTAQQIFRAGRAAYGFLCHLEVDEALIAAMADAFPGELAEGGLTRAALDAQIRSHLPLLMTQAAGVFARWAALL